MADDSIITLPGVVAPQAPGTAAAGNSIRFAREDHVHPAQSVPAAPTPSNNNPAALGAAAPGVSQDYSRADHVHPLPSPRLAFLTAISVGESGLVTLGLSVRRYTATVAGVVATDRLVVALNGIPQNGSLQDVYVSAANTISVGVLIPVLGIGSTVAVPIAVYRIV